MDESSHQRSASGKSFGIALFVVLTAAFIFTMAIRQSVSPTSTGTGKPAPAIQAEGWLNGPGPTEEELRGKVIVVDAWAFWCGPCRMAAPELVALYNRYKDKGVVFIGLTSEGQEADKQNRQFLQATKFTWPNGYGASKTLGDLNAHFIPQKWVFDRKNRIAWDEQSSESIETAIDRALKESP